MFRSRRRVPCRVLSRVVSSRFSSFPAIRHHHQLSTLCHYSCHHFTSPSSYGCFSSCSLDLCHPLLTAPLTRNLDAPSGLLGGSARDFASRLAALFICPTLGFDAYSSACVIGFVFYCF